MKPTLYYYEHCPYCVRVLTLIGMANIDVERVVLLNDDEKTPINMIGQKMLPILAIAPGKFMAESLDIVDYLSQMADFDLIEDKDKETQVNDFFADNRSAIYGLTMPRWVKQPFAEFATDEAIAYFVKKKTQAIGDFATALENSPQFEKDLHNSLLAAAPLFTALIEQPNSRAAIMLFAGLYGLRYVNDFAWPAEAQQFMQRMAKTSGMSL